MLRIVCALLLVRGAVADELLTALEGARGANKVTLCTGGATRCAAALWGRRWLLARASCVLRRDLSTARALHHASLPAADCASLPHDGVIPRVLRWYTHPEYRGGPRAGCEPGSWESRRDLAMLALDRDVVDRFDSLANVTDAEDQLRKFSGWMTQVYRKHYTRPEPRPAAARPMGAREMRNFFLLVILPLVMFVVVFLFVIFGTGTPVKVPYRNIDYVPIFDTDSIITP